MIRHIADLLRAGFAAAAIAAAVSMCVFAQGTGSGIERLRAMEGQEPGEAGAKGGGDDTQIGASIRAATAPGLAISGETDVEIQSRFNEIRRELLNERANAIDWWLAVTALVLTFFGVVVAISGFLGFRRFREIMREAQESAKAAANHAEEAEHLVLEIRKYRDESHEMTEYMKEVTAQTADDNPEQASQAFQGVQNNPEASLMDRAVASAVAFQAHGETKRAVEKWQAIANLAEESDADLAARAWFSIGYLIRHESMEKSVLAYDASIRLRPGNAHTYYNRGITRAGLGQYEAAITDFDEAIRVNPNYAFAYQNRGRVKARLGRYEAAIADHDEAIRLNPDCVHAYSDRGHARAKLDQREAAIADHDEAIRLDPTYAPAYYERGIAWLLRKEYGKAESDLFAASNRGMDVVAAFRSEYKSVADFEEQHGADIPEGIRRVLEP